MNPIVAEYLGTLILILMGSGICANSSLKDTFAKGFDWVLITLFAGDINPQHSLQDSISILSCKEFKNFGYCKNISFGNLFSFLTFADQTRPEQ